MYELKSTILIDWPNQANWPTGPATYPIPVLDAVPAEVQGFDETNNGAADYISGTGWQFRNTPGQTFLMVDRARPTDVIFFDPNVAAAIRIELNLPETVLQDDVTVTRPITVLDLVGLVKLTVSSSAQSLAGLEHCTNLIELDLTGSDVTNIDPLRGLVHLKKLNLKNCPVISILPLLDLPALEVVNIVGLPVNAVMAQQALDMIGDGILVVADLDVIGRPIRQFSVVADDSFEAIPAGDTASAVYIVWHYVAVNKYSIQFIDLEAVTMGETPTGTILRMGGQTLHDFGDATDLSIPEDLVNQVLGTQVELVIYKGSEDDYLIGTFDLTFPAGYVANPPEDTVTFTDLGFADQTKLNMLIDGDVLIRQAVLLKTLIIKYIELANVVGLEEFTGLTYLDLSFVGTPDVSIVSTFTNLATLSLAGNSTISSSFSNFGTAYNDMVGTSLHKIYPLSTYSISHPISNVFTDWVAHSLASIEPMTLISGSGPTQNLSMYNMNGPSDRRLIVGVAMFQESLGTTSVAFYSGANCDEYGPDTLIKKFDTNLTEVKKHVISASGSTSKTLEVTAHGYSVGDLIWLTASATIDTDFSATYGIYEVATISDANNIVIKNFDAVVDPTGKYVHKGHGFNHEELLAWPLGDFFVIWSGTGGPTYKFLWPNTYTAPTALPIGAMISDNLNQPTSVSQKTITHVTTGSPTTLTVTAHGLETMLPVIINGVIGVDINEEQLIYVIDANTLGLDGVTSAGTYVSGGTLTPAPSTTSGDVAFRIARNPFLRYVQCELQIHVTTPPIGIQTGLYTQKEDAFLQSHTYAESTNSLGSVVFHGDTVSSAEYMLIMVLSQGMLNRMAKEATYIKIVGQSYPEGIICTAQDGLPSGNPTPGQVRVKVITTKEIEGFKLDDLVIALDTIGSGPLMVGPFDTIFHATETIDNTTYSDLIRLEFSNDVQFGSPLVGDIKLAVVEVVA